MFNVTGTLQVLLPSKSGVSKAGTPWKMQTIVITVPYEEKTIKMAFAIWNIEQDISIPKGTQVNVEFTAETREFNGKYYTNLNATNIKVIGNPESFNAPINNNLTKQPYVPQQPDTPEQSTSDLPF